MDLQISHCLDAEERKLFPKSAKHTILYKPLKKVYTEMGGDGVGFECDRLGLEGDRVVLECDGEGLESDRVGLEYVFEPYFVSVYTKNHSNWWLKNEAKISWWVIFDQIRTYINGDTMVGVTGFQEQLIQTR